MVVLQFWVGMHNMAVRRTGSVTFTYDSLLNESTGSLKSFAGASMYLDSAKHKNPLENISLSSRATILNIWAKQAKKSESEEVQYSG